MPSVRVATGVAGLTTAGVLLMRFLAPCSCAVHHSAKMADAVVERSSRAFGAGFEFEVQSVALLLGIGKEKLHPSIRIGLTRQETKFPSSVKIGGERQIVDGERR